MQSSEFTWMCKNIFIKSRAINICLSKAYFHFFLAGQFLLQRLLDDTSKKFLKETIKYSHEIYDALNRRKPFILSKTNSRRSSVI